MRVLVDVEIPEEEHNYYVYSGNAKVPISNKDGIWIIADNLSHGCGGAAIRLSLSPDNIAFDESGKDKNTILQITASKETVAEIISALKLIYDNID